MPETRQNPLKAKGSSQKNKNVSQFGIAQTVNPRLTPTSHASENGGMGPHSVHRGPYLGSS